MPGTGWTWQEGSQISSDKLTFTAKMQQVIFYANANLAYENIKAGAATTLAATYQKYDQDTSVFTSIDLISPNQPWGYSASSDATIFCNSGRFTSAIDSEKEGGGSRVSIEFWSNGATASVNFFMEANLRTAMQETESVE